MSSDQTPQTPQEGGNTKTPSKGHRKWVFTLNNPVPEEKEKLLKNFNVWVCQLEKGESGTPHIQGFVELKHQKTLRAMKKYNPRVHWEPMHGTQISNIAYCTKMQGRLDGPWSKGVQLPEELDTITILRPWQEELKNILLTKPDKRTVYWYWDREGGSGKTEFCRYMKRLHGAVYVSGKAHDVKYAIASLLELQPIKIVIWDVPRSILDYISYEAVENVKNGLFFCGKYESKMVDINPPHVVIFANEPPNEYKLSKDRWKVVEIEGGGPALDPPNGGA